MSFKDSRIAFEHGARFERLALEKLQTLGYAATPVIDRTDGPDILIGDPADGAKCVTIEVKGSVRTSAGKRDKTTCFVFTLMRDNGRSKPVNEDVLLCYCDDGDAGLTWFILPGGIVRQLTSLKVYGDPLHYSGKWSEYRGAWRILDLAIAAKRAEGALP